MSGGQGLSPSSMTALWYMLRTEQADPDDPARTASELGRTLGVTRQRAFNTLGILRAAGLVTKEPAPRGRGWLWRLTVTGRQRLEQGQPRG